MVTADRETADRHEKAPLTARACHLVALAAACAIWLAGCGSQQPAAPLAPADPAWTFFTPDHVTEVAVEIDTASWDALREQTRTWGDVVAGPDCMSRPFANPFTWFPASVTVDGVRRDRAEVRKKGFVGSMREDRPSLKMRFDGIDPDQSLYGLKKLTLNNSYQDPTWLLQCLSYRVFEAADIPVPWCNFAHLTVNGQDLGLYVHLESVDRRWIRRHFVRDEGDLWEGTLSDFRFGWIGTFEKKGDVDDAEQMMVDRSSLWNVANAVAATVPDRDVRSRLSQAIDFDEFMRLWTVEKILEHWDGYSNKANNFFIYRDPADQRFVFSPSGTDQIAGIRDYQDAIVPPVSVFAGSAISNRLYAIPETRQLYAQTLRRMLDSAYHEDDLLAYIDRAQALVTPVLRRAGADLGSQAQAVERLRGWIRDRRAVLLADLENGPPEWRQDPWPSVCIADAGRIEGSFVTRFDPTASPFAQSDPFSLGNAILSVTYHGRGISFWRLGGVAGYNPSDPPATRWPLVWLTGQGQDGIWYNVGLGVAPAQFRPGTSGTFDGRYAWGGIWSWNPWTWQSSYLGGFDGGSLALDAAGIQRGARVSGRFQARVIRW